MVVSAVEWNCDMFPTQSRGGRPARGGVDDSEDDEPLHKRQPAKKDKAKEGKTKKSNAGRA